MKARVGLFFVFCLIAMPVVSIADIIGIHLFSECTVAVEATMQDHCKYAYCEEYIWSDPTTYITTNPIAHNACKFKGVAGWTCYTHDTDVACSYTVIYEDTGCNGEPVGGDTLYTNECSDNNGQGGDPPP